MTQPDIHLSSEAVRRHAASVDEVASMIDDCLTGAAHIQASAGSYGQLAGGLFTSVLNPFLDHAVGEMKSAVSASQALADTLRAMAGDFDITDAEAARQIEASND